MQTYKLTLAHINDTHSYFDPSRVQFKLTLANKSYQLQSHTGGYARIGYQVEQARHQAQQQQRDFLFLHAGDSFHGTLYFSQHNGLANADLLNRLKPDAMVLGNHEIDCGNQPIRAFLDNTDFAVMAGNMDVSREADDRADKLKQHPRFYDYDPQTQCAKVLLKPLGDTQVAIFGITLDQMKIISRPDPDSDFHHAVETCKQTIAQLHQAGIYHIIVLSHLGIIQDRELAKALPAISAIVGGHTHTLQGDFSDLGLSNMPYGEMVAGVPILHAGKHAETYGLAELTFDSQGNVIECQGNNYFMIDKQFILKSEQTIAETDYQLVRHYLEQHNGIKWHQVDEDIEQRLNDKYRPSVHAMQSKILGFIPRPFIHTRLPSKKCPHGSEIAPWVCCSLYHESRVINPEIQFSLHNAGGVRQSLPEGELSLADVIGQILPYDLPLVTYNIQGKYLFELLESAINSATDNSVIGSGTGGFPYTYGLKYFYDGKQPLGKRIVRLEIMAWFNGNKQWLAVDPNSYYTGVSSCYTVLGKEGYEAILNAKWQHTLTELTLPGAFIQFISKNNRLDKLLSPQVNYQSHL